MICLGVNTLGWSVGRGIDVLRIVGFGRGVGRGRFGGSY